MPRAARSRDCRVREDRCVVRSHRARAMAARGHRRAAATTPGARSHDAARLGVARGLSAPARRAAEVDGLVYAARDGARRPSPGGSTAPTGRGPERGGAFAPGSRATGSRMQSWGVRRSRRATRSSWRWPITPSGSDRSHRLIRCTSSTKFPERRRGGTVDRHAHRAQNETGPDRRPADRPHGLSNGISRSSCPPAAPRRDH